jgi:hypothetical protein
MVLTKVASKFKNTGGGTLFRNVGHGLVCGADHRDFKKSTIGRLCDMSWIKVLLFSSLLVPTECLMPAVRMRMPRATPSMSDNEPINMAETATAAIDQLLGLLSDEAEPPKTLLPLKTAVAEGDEGNIAAALYCVMVEQCLDYDMVGGLLYVRWQRTRTRMAPCGST